MLFTLINVILKFAIAEDFFYCKNKQDSNEVCIFVDGNNYERT